MEKFKYNIDDVVETKRKDDTGVIVVDDTFIVVGFARFKNLHENKYLLQKYNEKFSLDFTKGRWLDEEKLHKSTKQVKKWEDEIKSTNTTEKSSK